MLFVKRAIVIFSLFFFLNAQSLEDRAFEAYKQHKFTLAFSLFTQAAKMKHAKALFMVALFVEKGVGTIKDRKKAIKLYQLTIKEALLNVKNGNKKEIEYAILAAKRLFLLTHEKKYKLLLEKLQNLSQNDTLNKSYDEYLAMCPAAKVIPPQDAEGIETFSCDLFKEFPQRMQEFMKLRKERFEAQAKNDKKTGADIDKKIRVLIVPILKYLQQETFNCYVNANYYYDIKSCDYDYLAQSDLLLFKKRAYLLEKKMKEASIQDYKLDPFQKEDLINGLIEKFSNNTYEKEVFKIVRLY